jgi:5-formyltetrahydrofolate cyclo-ligase
VTIRFPDEMAPEEIEAFRAAAKEAIRQRMSQLRRALPEQARRERSAALCARLLAHPAFAAADVLLAYAPLRFEVDPEAIVLAAHAAGKTVALPRVEQATRTFSIHCYQPGDSLEESGHLIREPSPAAQVLPPDVVALVLVPGLAFDGQGQRLGFGQGYYDRMLPKMRNAVRVGLCYDLSLLPEVPHADHDVPMQLVVTDKRLLDLR